MGPGCGVNEAILWRDKGESLTGLSAFPHPDGSSAKPGKCIVIRAEAPPFTIGRRPGYRQPGATTLPRATIRLLPPSCGGVGETPRWGLS